MKAQAYEMARTDSMFLSSLTCPFFNASSDKKCEKKTEAQKKGLS